MQQKQLTSDIQWLTRMLASTRRKSIVFFISFGACLVALAIALNVGWILLNWREVALLIFGIIFFSAIIAGLVLNTIFLVREIRRNEQHDSFINAVTHELKTPIASIRLYLETLQTRDVNDEKKREFYNIMLADTDRLLTTVEQVLRAGQTGQKGRTLHTMQLDLGPLIRECIALTITRYRLAGDEITFTDHRENLTQSLIKADPEEIRAAISNLLDNAIKYSDRDIKVALALRDAGLKQISLEISDQGIGIPPAQLKRIFKRFYRVPGQMMARVKGTGLGLFIVQSIIERHGGRIKAQSEGEGRGTTFTILLPKAV